MFIIKKGINLSHWLSQVFGWSPREVFITEVDIVHIKQMGFDHVRLPVDEEELWDEHNNKIVNAWECMNNCINWCIKHELRIVLDMHILRSHHFNATNNEGAMTLWTDVEAQENFLKLWSQLSKELLHYSPDWLAYELMNEPVAPEHEMWNELLANLHRHVRALEPDRILVFGSNLWQFPHTYPYLKVPENDKKIILSIHTYDPLLFTHYKAYWLPIRSYHGEISYPGVPISENNYKKHINTQDSALVKMIAEHNRHFDKEELLKIISPAIEKSKQFGLQLYCSEFGCLSSVPKEMRLQYYNDIISVFNEEQIAFCHWDLKGDFGILEWDRKNYKTGKEHNEIISILLK